MPDGSSKTHKFARLLERTPDPGGRSSISFLFDGNELTARAGDSIAAALLNNGISQFRTTPVTGAPRAPYCMMGVCFDCLIQVDGVPNLQACMIEVRDGMTIVPMQGARSLTAGEDSA